MPHRDPETGKFVAGGGSHSYDDYEVFSSTAHIDIKAADVDGTTSAQYPDGQDFEGFLLADYDELVDRNEVLDLLRAQHRITVYCNATATEDGTVRGLAEISSAPTLQSTDDLDPSKSLDGTDFNVDYRRYDTDSIDVIGRPLVAHGQQGFFDSTTGAGGGGSAGEDDYTLSGGFPRVIGRFHPRDELFINGVLEASNVADAGIHMDVAVQHLYGVRTQ